MRLPIIEGVIRRRILVNFRVDPRVIKRLLPSRFRPKLHAGHAVAGICMIRLAHIRPRGFPEFVGIHSENAAHRIAVLWDDADGTTHEGVFITRRDTDSQLNCWLGGRLFPGEHHKATFDVVEASAGVTVSVKSRDRAVEIDVAGCVCETLPSTSIFSTLAESSAFFESGSLGYSVTRDPHRLDGITLKTHQWQVRPLEISHIQSSYFADETLFPPGSAEFDHALLMKDVRHEWHAAADFCV